MAKKKLLWSAKPQNEDYQAALDYLSLISSEARAKSRVSELRRAPVIHRSAKDLLRASRLALLPPKEAHVRSDLKKIARQKALSPVLLVRGNLGQGAPLTVADGYHRICAVCHFDESAPVAAQIVDP
ncbi:MAG: hypothetical protein JO042_07665 [Sinobacteraceae bacterium]|nr:hypothetical protein [Nevskiaceae bacterium]